MDWLIGKSKKKEKEFGGEHGPGYTNNKMTLYLEPNNCTTAFLSVSELKELILLPLGLNSREWIALQSYYVFENINLLYEIISSAYCTPASCPTMVGTGNIIYPWIDEKGKKTKLCAPLFIDHVMSNIQKTILDESFFPTKHGNQFPSNFELQARKILRWLFQVISHLYHSHYGHTIALCGLNSHLNTLLVHLLALATQVDRMPDKIPENNGLASTMAEDKNFVGRSDSLTIVGNKAHESETFSKAAYCDSTISSTSSVCTAIESTVSSPQHGSSSLNFQQNSSIVTRTKQQESLLNLHSFPGLSYVSTCPTSVPTVSSEPLIQTTAQNTTGPSQHCLTLNTTTMVTNTLTLVAPSFSTNSLMSEQTLAIYLTDSNPLTELVNLLKIRDEHQSNSVNCIQISSGPMALPSFSSSSRCCSYTQHLCSHECQNSSQGVMIIKEKKGKEIVTGNNISEARNNYHGQKTYSILGLDKLHNSILTPASHGQFTLNEQKLKAYDIHVDSTIAE